MQTRLFRAALAAAITLVTIASFAQTAPKQTEFPITATINAERVSVRRNARHNSYRVTRIQREARVTITSQMGDWLQIRTSDNRNGWIEQQFVNPDIPLPAIAPVQSGTPVVAVREDKSEDVNAATAAITSGAKKAATLNEPGTPTVGKTAPVPDPTAEPKGALAGTRNDIPTRSSPISAAGDAWKLFAYLVPTLLVILFAIRGLKRLQTHPVLGGMLSGQRQTAAIAQLPGQIGEKKLSLVERITTSLRSGANLTKARETGGSNIRLIESVPVAGYNLVLIEAKDRVLLLGAGNTGINVLSEWEASAAEEASESFESSLSRASRIMESLAEPNDVAERAKGMRVSDALLAAEGPGLRSVVASRAYNPEPQSVAAGGLDAAIRQAKEAIVRASRQSDNSQFAVAQDRAEFNA